MGRDRTKTMRICAAGLAMALSAACRVEVGPPGGRALEATSAGPTGTLLIYTSMYRHVIDAIDPVLERQFPGLKVEWLQAGSEKIATRLDAELSAGAPRADLVLTSDPLWYERLAREGHLLPYASIRALSLPRELVRPDGAYVTSRLSTMVIAYNERLLPKDEVPTSYAGLFDPRFTGKVTMPDPLGSGTTFTSLAFLVHAHGMEIIDRMKAARTIASGGNSSTITRIESGEHLLGMVLLENAVQSKRNGAPIAYVIPEDGAIAIPGPIAIPKGAPNPVAARAVYDALLSEELQKLMVQGDLHSPYAAIAPPPDTFPLERLLRTRFAWTPEFIESAVHDGEALRHRFAEVMGGS